MIVHLLNLIISMNDLEMVISACALNLHYSPFISQVIPSRQKNTL